MKREKRTNPRKSYGAVVAVTCGENFWHAYLQDISAGGAFIISNIFPTINTEVDLKFILPKIGEVEVSAFVRWVSKDKGFGVQFKPIGVKITNAINSVDSVDDFEEIFETDLVEE